MIQKILITDDDKGIVHLIKATLEKHGYEVKTAQDGAEGLRAIKSEQFDLLTVDLRMPEVDGWHFIMKVRQNDQYQKIPIVVLSSLLIEDAEPGKVDLVNAYIVKPFDILKLIEKIKELLK